MNIQDKEIIINQALLIAKESDLSLAENYLSEQLVKQDIDCYERICVLHTFKERLLDALESVKIGSRGWIRTWQ